MKRLLEVGPPWVADVRFLLDEWKTRLDLGVGVVVVMGRVVLGCGFRLLKSVVLMVMKLIVVVVV